MHISSIVCLSNPVEQYSFLHEFLHLLELFQGHLVLILVVIKPWKPESTVVVHIPASSLSLKPFQTLFIVDMAHELHFA